MISTVSEGTAARATEGCDPVYRHKRVAAEAMPRQTTGTTDQPSLVEHGTLAC